MDLHNIHELYAYNRWANARILDATAKLTEEQFLRDLRNSFPSVRDTLAHILGAEWIWLRRWKGTSPKGLPPGADFSTHAALRERWAEVEHEQTEYLDALKKEALETPLTFTNIAGKTLTFPLRYQLQHLVNHSTYHRGQITTMLRQLDAQPISTDLIVYVNSLSEAAKA